jgi:hydrophobic/amphiphilic exporter-1 (mainly G- bacteria), HAE1 family
MNLSRPFIFRPVMTTLVMLPLIVFGIIAYVFLPVSAIPAIEVAAITITTGYPGASPQDVARYISSPLERQFVLMQGIQYVSSQNDYQQSTIICQFHEGIDINVAAQSVQNAIQSAAGQLPSSLPVPPTYVKANPSDTPITYLVITSQTMPYQELYKWGYTFIGQQLGTVDGIARVATYGYPYAVRVDVDPQEIASRNVSFAEVSASIQNFTPDQPTGKLYGPNLSIPAIVNGREMDADKYNDMIIKYEDGEPVRLKDVGVAYEGLQNDKSTFRWFSHEKGEEGVVVLSVLKQQNFNTVQVCDDIIALVERLKTELPGSVDVTFPYSQSEFIKEAIGEVEMTLIIAFVLVVLVVFIYLGKIRNSVIPLITLPITVLGTFLLMKFFGFSVDIMSMSALTLAIGFLIDDAIIVLENIVRHVEMGHKPFKAALLGSKQIIITVISISVCLAAVFVPMLFLGGTIGKIFHEFGAVMIIAIVYSAFISLSLTPMLCSRFVTAHNQERKTKMEILSEKLNKWMLSIYEPSLKFILRHKKYAFFFAGANIALTLFFFVTLPKEFLPPDDLGVIEGFIMADEGTSPERMKGYLDEVTKICMENSAINTAARIDSYPTDNQAMFFMNLHPYNKRESIFKVVDELYPKINSLPGVRAFLKPFPLINLQVGNITAGKANYQYVIQGFDSDKVVKSAEKILETLHSSPKLAQLNSNMQADAPQLNVNIKRDAAYSYSSLTANAIEMAFQYAYGETYIAQINDTTDTYYVILQAKPGADAYPTDLSELYVGEDEEQVAMDSIVDTEVIRGPLEINNINTLPSVTLSFNVGEGYSLSEAIAEIQSVTQDFPPGVFGSLAGSSEAFERTFKQFILLIIAAIFVIYIVLGILYENYLHPITALSALPFAVFGGLLSLMVCGQFLSIYALIGLILLMGIVMKNGILVIDFALEEMNDQGKSAYDAVLTACLIRFRPIIMTTLAAMMGALPVAFGVGGTIAKGRAPLGIAVVGGLIFSQLITLYVTPCFFIVVSQLHTYFTKKYPMFQEKHEPDSEV